MVFLNIFSNKPKKEKPEPKIIIDHREKNSLVVSELLNKPLSIEFRQLPIADYIINDIAIERKTVSDFKASILNKRIFDQIKNLQQYPKHLLILEGILDEDLYKIGMHENAFRGFMLSLALSYNIHIIFTHNAEDTAKYLYVLALKKGKTSISIHPKRILLSPEEQVQFILEGFPNIDPVKAKKLIERFGSLKKIFNASEEELFSVLGKRGKEFYYWIIKNNFKIPLP